MKLYISAAMELNNDQVIHPKRLQKAIVENVGPFPPQSQMYVQDQDLQQVMIEAWDYVVDWYLKCFDYFIENEGIEYIFSHLHSIDLIEHTFIRFMHGIGFNEYDTDVYAFWMERLYQQTDRYLGGLLHYLDEGWTILVISDHGLLVPPEDDIPLLGDGFGCNIRVMEELGYTVLKKDENGNELREIDYSKTRAVANRGNHIHINLKGRNQHGIVEPADKYALETQIISDLYNYRNAEGKRIVSIAMRNKEAEILGLNGEESGDILYWLEEGFNRLHGDSLPTFQGMHESSVSPIFIAAGPGIKKNFVTERTIRTIDVAPTIAVLAGVAMPEQCEGAPIYQILE